MAETKMKVAVAIDGSAQAEQALDFYLETCRSEKHELLLICCMELPYLPMEVRTDVAEDIIKRCQNEEKEVEKKYQSKLKDKGIPFRVVADFGSPGEYVCKAAANEGCGLIVVGTRGLGKIRRTIMGSVSDFVLHHSHCPVMICRK